MQFKINALLASEPWQHLRPQQKTWVLAVIESSDEPRATRLAYPKASEKSLVVMRYEIRRSPHVRAALAFWNGPPNEIQESLNRLQAENQHLKAVEEQVVEMIAQIIVDLPKVRPAEEATAVYENINGVVVVKIPMSEAVAA